MWILVNKNNIWNEKKKQNFQGNNFKDVLKDVNVDGRRFSFPFKFNNKKKTYKLLFNFQTVIENNLKILFMYVTPKKNVFYSKRVSRALFLLP